MSAPASPTVLCLASYEKGFDFLSECAAQGCRVLLLTLSKLADAPWPRDAIADFRHMPDLENRQHVLNAVSWLARSERIERIVALDEFDLEIAAGLREHLRVPGMGESAVRYVRDKLAMRIAAAGAGLRVPAFVGAIHQPAIAQFAERVPPPWILKPRLSASTVGIRRVGTADELWRTIESLGDAQSLFVLEQFVSGRVYHVDGVLAGPELVFAEAHVYARPPLEVYHGGGIFCSRTLERDGAEAVALRALTAQVADALGIRDSAIHAEFIRGDDGEFYFLEAAARVGGANISDMVEAATGLNLWREWAKVEIAAARGARYRPAPARSEYAGVLISLARQEWPDTSAYGDAEIVRRLDRRHHAGLIVSSADAGRVATLLDQYMRRFYDDFHAALPPADKPTA